MNRRKFLVRGSVASAALFVNPGIRSATSDQSPANPAVQPVVISTWDFGYQANEVAWKLLANGSNPLDAVEQGIKIIESDPDNLSVGVGGLPDRDGRVTLDACIMDDKGQAGSVSFLEGIAHPISVARLVMEETPHVMLVGDGARQFALEKGFKEENLLTEKARKAWEEWLIKSEYKPVINIENHDTVGLLAMDREGNLSGGCSTSGLAYKMHGRVGDSPVIGAGLYVDNEVGAAVATGLGEVVLRSLSTFLVVELMRSGYTPAEACREAVTRIANKNPDFRDFQVGIIALNKEGEYGSYALHPGFSFAVRNNTINEVIESASFI